MGTNLHDIRDIFWNNKKQLKLIIVVAHPDDFEIGCLGTVLRLINEKVKFEISLVVFCCNDLRRRSEQLNSIRALEKKIKKKINVHLFDYPDTMLNNYIDKIKKDLHTIKKSFSRIDNLCVFTHHSMDMHQDHMAVNKAVLQSIRTYKIFGFEILKYEEDLIRKPLYIKVDRDIAEYKAKHILKNYASQKKKFWFKKETFISLQRVRGVSAGEDFAEALAIEKLSY
jgi:LmbE family N-acetylglucosaminyl deacetylase|tara:strand:- start:158 stop:835 length:678 start_codon:yes stop_codon:yes gene_type:complete